MSHAAEPRPIEQRIRSGNAGGAFAVTNCNDYPDRPSLGQAMPIIEQQVALGPNFGGVLAIQYALGCTGLKLDPDPVPTITGRGSNVPVLVSKKTSSALTRSATYWLKMVSLCATHHLALFGNTLGRAQVITSH